MIIFREASHGRCVRALVLSPVADREEEPEMTRPTFRELSACVRLSDCRRSANHSALGGGPMADNDGPSAVTRRDLLKLGATVVAGAATVDSACAPITLPGKPPTGPPGQYDVIIIGTGFGASVAAMELATACPKAKILMLEKGSY